jgi:hypothetical protein
VEDRTWDGQAALTVMPVFCIRGRHAAGNAFYRLCLTPTPPANSKTIKSSARVDSRNLVLASHYCGPHSRKGLVAVGVVFPVKGALS